MIEPEMKDGVPMCTLEMYEKDYADRHLVHGVIEKWAKEKPDVIALMHVDTNREWTWKQFSDTISALAIKLVDMGIQKGDFVATSLPYLAEHIFLEYACFKIGAIHVPLDMRLKPQEVIRCLSLVKAKVFCHLGKVNVLGKDVDFGQLAMAVKGKCPFIEHYIQFAAPEECNANAICAFVLAKEAEVLAKSVLTGGNPELGKKYQEACLSIKETDGCQVIYTTGSTGFPKPALQSHRGITSQNLCLAKGFDIGEEDLMLVNLPPSHVGGQAEQLMTPLFMGGKAVVMNAFKPDLTMEAIQKYKITAFGQIPALFSYEWMLPNYEDYDKSSLKFALYGGQAVSRQFLEKLAKMSPKFGTGDGLTEMCGFCTYSPLDGTVDDILAGVGYAMPISPLTIREPMKDDGTAGAEKAQGEIGDICFSGPQLFIEYVNDPENTKKTISKEGILYTGDLGSYNEKGLHFSGRSKLMIKPKGFNVFPTEVENFIADKLKDKVSGVACVGAKHEIITEAIVAFVVKKKDADVTVDEVNAAAKDMASYKRPSLVIIVDEMPLNRVAKTDYMTLKAQAKEAVEKIRAEGGWDAAAFK
jgi:fatty-acyl-CoA synthase